MAARFVAPAERPSRAVSPRVPPQSIPITIPTPPVHPSRNPTSEHVRSASFQGALNSQRLSPAPPSIIPPPPSPPPPLPPRRPLTPPITVPNIILHKGQEDGYISENDSAEDVSDDLTDEELRTLFDDEEVERFLKLFAKHVSEVTMMPTAASSSSSAPQTPTKITIVESESSSIHPDEAMLFTSSPVDDLDNVDDENDGQWVEVDSLSKRAALPDKTPVPKGPPQSPAAYVASKLAMVLPPQTPHLPPTPFSLSSLTLAYQRLYMIMYPTYVPFLTHLWALATWRDSQKSLTWCIVYFSLWCFNLLLPALFLKIVYSLLRRRFLPYPTAAELRERRRTAREAEALGDAMQQSGVGIGGGAAGWLGVTTGAAAGDIGIMDIWRILRDASKGKKEKLKAMAAEHLPPDDETPLDESMRGNLEKKVLKQVKKELRVKKKEEDWKGGAVKALEEIADIHERIKNIFLWRRPEASRTYGAVLATLCLSTAFLPDKYLLKLIYGFIGIAFWFIIPVIKALSPEDRARFPPAFADAPTDAEWAMEIIGARAARGESVIPHDAALKARRKAEKTREKAARRNARHAAHSPIDLRASASTVTLGLVPEGTQRAASPSSASRSLRVEEKKDIDWGKWKDRASKGMAWGDQGIQLFTKDADGPRPVDPTSLRSGLSNLASGGGGPESAILTFPATYCSTPGLLFLAVDTLTFTPAVASSTSSRVVLDLSRVRGVKKAGRLGGIAIKYEDGNGEKEVKFAWVHKRDEVFARLVGWGNRRWTKV